MEERTVNLVQEAEIMRTDATTILLGESPQLKMLRGLIARVARTEVTVLITSLRRISPRIPRRWNSL